MLQTILAFAIRLLAFLATLWFIKRLLYPFAARRRQPPTPPVNYMVKDPICGMYLDLRLAVRMDRKDESLYFCSEECRRKFLANQP